MGRGRMPFAGTLKVEVVRYIPLIGSPATMPVARARYELEREDTLYLALSATHKVKMPEIQWSTKSIWRMTRQEYDRWMAPVKEGK